MKKILLFSTCILLAAGSGYAQSKKDLKRQLEESKQQAELVKQQADSVKDQAYMMKQQADSVKNVYTAQADKSKKATLMVIPSDNWCAQRYFTLTFDDQGRKVIVSDLKTAFLEDTEVGNVISKVGQMLTDAGYSLKDCEQELKNINNREGEDAYTTSKTSGASLMEGPLDVLKRRTKSDIIIQVGWNVNKEPAGLSVTFTLEAFDSYTSKRIATANGTSPASNDIVIRQLENAIKERIPEFTAQMDKWYHNAQLNGREILLTVRTWDSWENDLETEYEGDELLDVIQGWIEGHTVNGNFNLSDQTEYMAQFEQVRIPMLDEKGKALDARGFASNLRKFLAKDPYNIQSKVMIRGLGEAILVLGEK